MSTSKTARSCHILALQIDYIFEVFKENSHGNMIWEMANWSVSIIKRQKKSWNHRRHFSVSKKELKRSGSFDVSYSNFLRNFLMFLGFLLKHSMFFFSIQGTWIHICFWNKSKKNETQFFLIYIMTKRSLDLQTFWIPLQLCQ